LEIILFTLVGIALYLICDRLLLFLERLHGEPLPQRNVVFFVLILSLSLATFTVLRGVVVPNEGAQHDQQEQQPAEGGDQPAQPH